MSPEGTSILSTGADEALIYLTKAAKPPAKGLLSPEPKRPSTTTVPDESKGGSNSWVTSTRSTAFFS